MERRQFLGISAGLLAVASSCQPESPLSPAPAAPPSGAPATLPPTPTESTATIPPTQEAPKGPQKMPMLFVGHGNPMHALGSNPWADAWRTLGKTLPTPKTILAVSAHWYVPELATTAQETPKTIHDFYGFPPELYALNYPAPGSPALAAQVVDLLNAHKAKVSVDWGLDHGTWSVLSHLFPLADIPVVQLSIHADLEPAEHLSIAALLAPLREQGVLIFASGNITHNLRHAMDSMRRNDLSPAQWADAFDADVALALQRHDKDFLAGALKTPNGRLSHPTPDHFLPLLYPAGASSADDRITFPVTGMDMGTLSMRAVLFQAPI